jgi:hypothetical protein
VAATLTEHPHDPQASRGCAKVRQQAFDVQAARTRLEQAE